MCDSSGAKRAAACRYEKASSGAVSDSGRFIRNSGGAERVATAPTEISRFVFLWSTKHFL
ncbi:hypothetical protein A2U01_0063443 [Trifolium medium]|uniref:Uncharacterized protein n=1 Tax=Trifolium medium TaxID=97028 RepID=A0A392S1E9_9FABA|nr:hypothetical protein [Trifolium medium]